MVSGVNEYRRLLLIGELEMKLLCVELQWKALVEEHWNIISMFSCQCLALIGVRLEISHIIGIVAFSLFTIKLIYIKEQS